MSTRTTTASEWRTPWNDDPPPPRDEDAPPDAGDATDGDASPAVEEQPETFAHDIKLALADIQRALGATRTADREPLFVSARDLFAREYPATQWRVHGLVSEGGILMIGAEPKSCKTWLASEVAVAVATGTSVCGEFPTARGAVAYFFAEDEARQVRNRVGALLAGRQLNPAALEDRLHVCPRGKFLDVTRDEDLAWIVASCRRIGKIDLLIADPLRDISSAAEDKSDEMSPVMRRLRLLGELLGSTVAVAHHAAKASADAAKRRPGQRMRGSGAIHGATDSGIYIGVRGGDGVAHFELEVDSEIKGARSAGRFALELSVQDDPDGAAVRATWAVTRDLQRSKTGALASADDSAMFDLVRQLAIRGEHRSKTALRDHEECRVPDKRARAALERLIDTGRLELRGAAIHLPAPQGSDEVTR